MLSSFSIPKHPFSIQSVRSFGEFKLTRSDNFWENMWEIPADELVLIQEPYSHENLFN